MDALRMPTQYNFTPCFDRRYDVGDYILNVGSVPHEILCSARSTNTCRHVCRYILHFFPVVFHFFCEQNSHRSMGNGAVDVCSHVRFVVQVEDVDKGWLDVVEAKARSNKAKIYPSIDGRYNVPADSMHD